MSEEEAPPGAEEVAVEPPPLAASTPAALHEPEPMPRVEALSEPLGR